MWSSQLLHELFPPGAAVAQEWVSAGTEGTSDGQSDGLYEAERRLVNSASEGRLRQFAAGRRCARRALSGLGHDPAPVLMGADREPIWPDGVVGSITHTGDYAAAAVAPAASLAGLGLDAERIRPLTTGQRALITAPGERLAPAGSGDLDPVLLAFCAKEAAFKALFPLVRRWIDYRQARVAFSGEAFTVEVIAAAPDPAATTAADIAPIEGRWRLVEGLVLAVAYIEAWS